MFKGYVSITSLFLPDDENTARDKLKAIDTIVEKLVSLNLELLSLQAVPDDAAIFHSADDHLPDGAPSGHEQR